LGFFDRKGTQKRASLKIAPMSIEKYQQTSSQKKKKYCSRKQFPSQDSNDLAINQTEHAR
jgi:hypothetical protein